MVEKTPVGLRGSMAQPQAMGLHTNQLRLALSAREWKTMDRIAIEGGYMLPRSARLAYASLSVAYDA